MTQGDKGRPETMGDLSTVLTSLASIIVSDFNHKMHLLRVQRQRKGHFKYKDWLLASQTLWGRQPLGNLVRGLKR